MSNGIYGVMTAQRVHVLLAECSSDENILTVFDLKSMHDDWHVAKTPPANEVYKTVKLRRYDSDM